MVRLCSSAAALVVSSLRILRGTRGLARRTFIQAGATGSGVDSAADSPYPAFVVSFSTTTGRQSSRLLPAFSIAAGHSNIGEA